MNRLDRYLFMQQLGSFGFFSLALAGIIWLTQTLPLMEIIIDNGHSGVIFLEFAALILPNVLTVVLPVAVFVSTLFTVNRLFGESEMAVILSSGLSPTRIIRATVAVGTIMMLAMFVLIIALMPRSTTRLANRIAEVREDSLMSLLREKQFIHPVAGVTIYIKDSSKAGEIEGIFLNDQRDSAQPVTYSAKQALLLQDNNELRLVMNQGIIQRYSVSNTILNIIEFDQFVFDLSSIVAQTRNRIRVPSEYYISELLDPEQIIADGGALSAGVYFAEAHLRLALPLMGLVLPLYAFSMLMTANYRRTGLGLRISLTGASGIFLLGTTLTIKTWVSTNPDMYLVAYAPALICMILSLTALTRNRVKRNLRQVPVVVA